MGKWPLQLNDRWLVGALATVAGFLIGYTVASQLLGSCLGLTDFDNGDRATGLDGRRVISVV